MDQFPAISAALKKGRNGMMKGCNNICGSVGDDPRKEERKWQTI